MRKNAKIVFIVILSIVLSILCFACSNVIQTIEYRQSVDVRYADSYEILSTSKAQEGSLEYQDVERVHKKIVVDTRVKGNHVLGLYAPKGEKIKVEISSSQISQNNEIVINANLANEQRFVLDAELKEIEIENGGFVELDYKGFLDEANCFVVKVDGCVESSYFRYGIDEIENISMVGDYTTLDATNVRIYVKNQYITNKNEIKDVMFWWRNTIDLFDRTLKLGSYKQDFSPTSIFVDGDSFNIIPDKNLIFVPEEYASSILEFSKLVSGNKDKILTLLNEIANEKTEQYSALISDALIPKANEVLASYVYASMIDSTCADFSYEKNYILDAAQCMQKIIDQNFISDEEKAISLVMNVYYTYGDNEIIKDMDQILLGKMDSFVCDVAMANNANLISFADAFGLTLSEEQKSQQKNGEEFVFVSNKYSFGQAGSKNKTGLHFYMGESSEIDFNEGLVKKDSEDWKVISVEGSCWSKKSDSVYVFTPDAENLKTNYNIIVSNGNKEIVLSGNASTDIAVSNYKLYSNISYENLGSDKLNDAIKSIKKETVPTMVKALTKAEIPQEEEIDTTSYSLAITNGCLEIPEDGKYTFYLKSSGLCKVDFGVKDHNFEMFNNILTVGKYTKELKYDISLQKGFKYYYTIYNLSNKGSGYAKLGILKNDIDLSSVTDEEIDINSDYLVFNNKHLERNSIVKFDPGVKSLDIFNKQEATTNSFAFADIREHSSNLEVTQTKSSVHIEGSAKKNEMAKFIVHLYSSAVIDYFEIGVNAMAGVNIKLSAESDFSKELVNAKLVNGNNRFEIETTKAYAEYRVEFTSDEDFNVDVTYLEFGEDIIELQLVPSTSTDVEYIGEWATIHTYNALNNSLSISHSQTASFKYSFNGDYIAIYAVKDTQFGGATIFIDGNEMTTIDLYSDITMCNQLVYNTKLKPGDHVIEIKANGETPINIDYCAVSILGESKINNDFTKIWYIVFIPSIVIVAMFVCIGLDIKEKQKKKKEQKSSI